MLACPLGARRPIVWLCRTSRDNGLSPKRGVQPDLFVVPLVAGRAPKHFDDVKRLLLAVEVLSPSTARADRVVKRMLYRDEQVAEYWVVDLDARTIERSTRPDARPEILARGIEWLPTGASIPLATHLETYFATLPDA
jgi:Uma2 family endonuclease